ncbi:MAG: hypothetical protein ACRDNL_28490 [Spirillospora sp.]
MTAFATTTLPAAHAEPPDPPAAARSGWTVTGEIGRMLGRVPAGAEVKVTISEDGRKAAITGGVGLRNPGASLSVINSKGGLPKEGIGFDAKRSAGGRTFGVTGNLPTRTVKSYQEQSVGGVKVRTGPEETEPGLGYSVKTGRGSAGAYLTYTRHVDLTEAQAKTLQSIKENQAAIQRGLEIAERIGQFADPVTRGQAFMDLGNLAFQTIREAGPEIVRSIESLIGPIGPVDPRNMPTPAALPPGFTPEQPPAEVPAVEPPTDQPLSDQPPEASNPMGGNPTGGDTPEAGAEPADQGEGPTTEGGTTENGNTPISDGGNTPAGDGGGY